MPVEKIRKQSVFFYVLFSFLSVSVRSLHGGLLISQGQRSALLHWLTAVQKCNVLSAPRHKFQL